MVSQIYVPSSKETKISYSNSESGSTNRSLNGPRIWVDYKNYFILFTCFNKINNFLKLSIKIFQCI